MVMSIQHDDFTNKNGDLKRNKGWYNGDISWTWPTSWQGDALKMAAPRVTTPGPHHKWWRPQRRGEHQRPKWQVHYEKKGCHQKVCSKRSYRISMEEITIVYSDVYNVIENSEAHELSHSKNLENMCFTPKKRHVEGRSHSWVPVIVWLLWNLTTGLLWDITTDILGYTYRGVPPSCRLFLFIPYVFFYHQKIKTYLSYNQ